MINFILNKIRLTYYLLALFVFFCVLFAFLPTYQFNSAVLTLFSVNSFLYGFYISPILNGQKTRIEELHRIIRSEANAVYGVQIKLKKLPSSLRNNIQQMIAKYLKTKMKGRDVEFAEKEYEDLITFCINYKGDKKDEVEAVLDALVANQQNRTQFMMQMSNKVYANEWMIMAVLFSITLGVIMTMNVGDLLIIQIVKALLCTGLAMLMVILLKFNTLSHEKAKEIWGPFKKLLATHFYQID